MSVSYVGGGVEFKTCVNSGKDGFGLTLFDSKVLKTLFQNTLKGEECNCQIIYCVAVAVNE